MSIPALVLEWLELKNLAEHTKIADMPAPEFEIDRERALAKACAYRDVLEKLKELDP